jgi:hypothetical protein
MQSVIIMVLNVFKVFALNLDSFITLIKNHRKIVNIEFSVKEVVENFSKLFTVHL